MNEPTIRKSAVASMAKYQERRVSMGVRFLVWFALVMVVNLPVVAFAQSPCPGIHMKVLNIKNSTGTVACALFESSVGFPNEFLRSATNIMSIKIQKTNARCDFEISRRVRMR